MSVNYNRDELRVYTPASDNAELLAKLSASNSRVIVAYTLSNGEADKTEPMPAALAAPMVATLERLGSTVRLTRFEG